MVQAQTHARSLEGAGQCLLGDVGDGAWGEQQGRAPGTHPRDVWLSLRHGEGQKDVTYPSWGWTGTRYWPASTLVPTWEQL